MKEWDEEGFQARVDARVKQLGRSRSGLLKAAGFKGDELLHPPTHSRRIDTIIKIACALNWTLGQALGIEDTTLPLNRRAEIDPRRLARAWAIAEEADGSRPKSREIGRTADIASRVYSLLLEHESTGKSLSDEKVRSVIASTLRRFPPGPLSSAE